MIYLFFFSWDEIDLYTCPSCQKNLAGQLELILYFVIVGENSKTPAVVINEIRAAILSDEKITFRAETLHLAFTRYPLVTEDLENDANLPKNLPR